MLAHCRALVKEIEKLRYQVESYWYTRASRLELKDGDKNTFYFHHNAKQRRKRNKIVGIEDNEGCWCEKEEEAGRVIDSYFRELFESCNPNNMEAVAAVMREVITPEMNELFDRDLSDAKVKEALFQMHPQKAPSSDSMTTRFYQIYLDVVGRDVCSFVRDWWMGKANLTEVNQNNVVLIPKCPEPKRITEFRPTSLCNVL
ncbi:uncharacterized protein LOC141638147 [Silene latifolia]|uniref:uncharacterized protein LOC141638147 n=1 Tax=Silene latifolia TaxID=37657 RepID=UPI003D78AF49